MAGHSVIITGGFGVLGSAVAAAFAATGDRVARVDFASSPSEPLDGALDIGGVDLTEQAAAARVVTRVAEAFGSIDILINIAGGFVWQPLAEGGEDTWNRMFAMNAVTCVNMIRATLPQLTASKRAHIVNIGALGARDAAAGMGPYAASKGAVHRLTESLAEELKGQDITINAVLPSIIDTPANRRDMPQANFAEWVQPAAIADVILFLASPAARAISGALIPVTRGG